MKMHYFWGAVCSILVAPLLVMAQSSDPEISRLSLPVAAPGDSVTIYGENLLHATTITLYSTADRNIAIEVNAAAADEDGSEETFVVPQPMAPGEYAVAVWADGSQVSSNEVALTIEANDLEVAKEPEIDHLSLLSAAPGDEVVIYGENLLDATKVTLYSIANRNVALGVTAEPAAPAADEEGREETFVVPQNAAPGKYGVVVWADGSQVSSNEVYLTIVSKVPGQPEISRLSKVEAAPGASVTIYGSNLLYANTITLYSLADRNNAININAAVADNDGSEETFVVPQTVADGDYGVVVWVAGSQVSSNEVYLAVKSAKSGQTSSVAEPAIIQSNGSVTSADADKVKMQLIQLIQQLIAELQKQLAELNS